MGLRILYLAPHCRVPPMDGADRRAWRLFGGLLQARASGVFIGRCGRTVSTAEEDGSFEVRDSKILPAIISVLSGGDYWQSKMLSPAVWNSVKAVSHETFDAVVVNFLYSTPLLRVLAGITSRLVIDTHNYDPSVFGGFAANARNPLTRLLCQRAIATSRDALEKLPSGCTMVHVSESDARSWAADRSDVIHEVVENGCDVMPRTRSPGYDSALKRLVFVGSLSAQMNRDALKHFAAAFWPRLRKVARMTILGSNPGSDISALCRDLGWDLYPNVSDLELARAYEDSHFAILPFEYGAGSKLKYFEALGRGLPVLATQAGVVGLRRIPGSVIVSDSVDDWERAIMNPGALPQEAATSGVASASDHSWGALSDQFLRVIARTASVRIA